MNVYKRLADVQSVLKAPKNQYNSFGKYNYRSCEDIIEAAKPICIENGLLLIVSDEIVCKGGKNYVEATATVIDIETEKDITCTASAREAETKKGMDDSQITGSTSSYARKYALNGLFAIDDTKDADTDEHANKTQNKTKHKKENINDKEWNKQSVINFGKHKGQTISEVWKTDKQYLEYLRDNASDEGLKEYLSQILPTVTENDAYEHMFSQDGM